MTTVSVRFHVMAHFRIVASKGCFYATDVGVEPPYVFNVLGTRYCAALSIAYS